MIIIPAPRLRTVLYEGPGTQPLDSSLRLEILQVLLDQGYAVRVSQVVEPLHHDGACIELFLGQFTSDLPSTIDESGPDGKLFFRDISGMDSTKVWETVEAVCSETGAHKHSEWKPWFPVIDYTRCVNCQQCLSFCLFGVYGVSSDGMIEVQNEASCKTDCPACARVCPEAAIIFPKYHSSPINGDIIGSQEQKQEVIQISIPNLLGGDALQALRDRSTRTKQRFSKDRDEVQAREERQKHLMEIQKALDIPDGLLQQLSSLGDTTSPGNHPDTEE